MDQLWILKRIPDCVCLDVRILSRKRNLDHRSLFSLGWYVYEFIQIIFFEPNSFKLRCETVSGIVLCTFELLHFCFRMSGCGCGFGFEQKYWRFDGFGEKRHGSADLHNPIHPPPLGKPLTGNMFSMENKIKIWSAKILPSQSVPTVTRKLQALEKTHPVTGPLCALKNKTNRNICCQSISLI